GAGCAGPVREGGHGGGAAPAVVAFVVSGGPGAVLAEFAYGPFDDVALLVGGGVEGGRAPAPATTSAPVAGLVGGLGDGGLDAAPAQGSAGRGAGGRLVA